MEIDVCMDLSHACSTYIKHQIVENDCYKMQLTSSRLTKPAREPPLDHILSITLSILLFTLHFVFPSVSKA